ncbi:general stress protein [Georgenia daeguensis]|uniref:General stress protein 17M-like domain-containing protein n=1 Tax=Georgenia daeguensis TaxID=908355 RepID=A0ABP8EPD6_9MICO
MTTTPTPIPSSPAGTTSDYRPLVELDSYTEAQSLVDHLSDHGFPVGQVRIIGTGLHSVEQVTKRVTNGSAALRGAGSGAWFGLLMGLLLGIFLPGAAWLTVLLTAVVLGAVWGAVLGFIAHWSTRGTRDFASVKGLQASRYEVQVAAAELAHARKIAQL